MSSDECKAIFRDISAKVMEELDSKEFKTSKTVAKRFADNGCGIIEFQQSRDNTKTYIKFTINVGIVYKDLLDKSEPEISEATVMNAHIRSRIGYLMPEQCDKWWTITPGCNATTLGQEVKDAIQQFATPYVNRFLFDIRACVALWETGVSPGLTDMQRERLLLKAKKLLA